MTNTKRYTLFILLFSLAFLERVAFDMGSNYELVTATMVIASIYLGSKHSTLLVLLVMFLSDLIIGNSSIFIFTWTGFLIPALLATKLISKKSLSTKMMSGTLAGAATVGFFFIWTNFGVWLTSTMYTKDIAGLTQSYINALPFLRNQAVSALLFIPSGIVTTEYLHRMSEKIQFRTIQNKLFT